MVGAGFKPAPTADRAPELAGFKPAPTADRAPELAGFKPAPTADRAPELAGFKPAPTAGQAPELAGFKPAPTADRAPELAGFKPAPTGPAIHRRRSIRLRGYDYTQAGFYFVTVCIRDRECLFGKVVDNVVCLNEYGMLAAQVWEDLPNHYPHLELDHFVVMPNHFHGIAVLTPVGAGLESANSDTRPTVGAGLKPANSGARSAAGAGLKPAPTKRHGLPEIVRAFKTFSARRINEIRQTPGTAVWQRNYYEHVIRDERDYDRIAEYIANNPQRWEEDSLHPGSPGFEPTHPGAKSTVEFPRSGVASTVELTHPGVTSTVEFTHPGVTSTVGAGFKPAPTNRGNDGGADE